MQGDARGGLCHLASQNSRKLLQDKLFGTGFPILLKLLCNDYFSLGDVMKISLISSVETSKQVLSHGKIRFCIDTFSKEVIKIFIFISQ